MSELVATKVVDFPACRLIGKSIVCTMETIQPDLPNLWGRCFEDGSMAALEAMEGDLICPDHVDWMGEFDPATGKFPCIVGMLLKPGTPVPAGYDFRDLGQTRMFIGQVRGTEADGDVYANGADLTMKAMAEQGFAYDDGQGYSLEVYDRERFAAALERGDETVILDNYMPVK